MIFSSDDVKKKIKTIRLLKNSVLEIYDVIEMEPSEIKYDLCPYDWQDLESSTYFQRKRWFASSSFFFYWK